MSTKQDNNANQKKQQGLLARLARPSQGRPASAGAMAPLSSGGS